jgi:serine/threonine protein kinase
LRYHLENRERTGMSENDVRFYAAEMVLGLEELHHLMIVYRDMKPDNILLDGDGHLRLSDFGISVQLSADKKWVTRGRAGTPGYQAPELLANHAYGVSPDVWSFGITVFEMLHRKRPFKSVKLNQELSPNHFDNLSFSALLSAEARDFISGLLTVDHHKRLGYQPKGGWNWAKVKAHPFFRGIDWEAIAHKQVTPPIKPDTDRANCPGDHDLEGTCQFAHKRTHTRVPSLLSLAAIGL